MAKKLKIKTILKNFDFLGTIKVYDSETDEELYSGDPNAYPWSLVNMTVDTNEEAEGLFVGIDEKSKEPYLGIIVTEDL